MQLSLKRCYIWLLCLALLCTNLVACGELVDEGTGMPEGSQQATQISTSQATNGKIAVLFDGTHGERLGNADWVISNSIPDPLKEDAQPQEERDWTGGISAWGVDLQRTGNYTLKTSNTTITYGNAKNPLDLSKFQVFVVPEPNINFGKAEKNAIVSFVQNGGGLFIVADHTGSDRNNDGYDSPRIFNDLMSTNSIEKDPFGLRFDSADINYDNPNSIPANKATSDPILNGDFGRVTSTTARSGTTMTLTNSAAEGLIYVSRVKNTGKTGVFVAKSSFGKGRIVAIGDSSVIDDGTCIRGDKCYDGWLDPKGQNRALVLNATQWLAQN